MLHFDFEVDFDAETLPESLLPKLNLGKLQADISTTSDGYSRPIYLNPVLKE